MPKPLRGECEVEIGGEKYTLRLGIGELEELDSITGLGTLELARSLSSQSAKISHAVAVLCQAMPGENGKKLSPSAVRRIVTGGGYFESIQAAVAVLTAVLADPTPGNADAAGAKDSTPAA